jgi:hypothetical protein
MMGLPGYDAWKLATPPEYEQISECPECDTSLDENGECPACGYGLPDEGDDYDTLEEAAMDR